jgi:hypothetical protein
LPWGVRAGSRLADACLNLSPIAHQATVYQQRGREASNSRRKILMRSGWLPDTGPRAIIAACHSHLPS